MPNHPIVSASYPEFIDSCRKVVSASRSATLDLDRLEDLLPIVDGRTYPDWSWYLPEGENDLVHALREFAINAALNGGYFQVTDTGIRQWQSKGSGSRALLEWIEGLREDGFLSAAGLRGDEAAQDAYRARLEGLPFAGQRLQILLSFADPQGETALRRMARQIETDCRLTGICHLTMGHVAELTHAFPLAFGGDPFRKKAVLALLELAGWLYHRKGESVTAELPIPSDYQIPRILAWKGVIRPSDELEKLIRNETRLIDVDSEPVMAFRAAAVVAAHELARRADVPDIVVDGALFLTFRKDPDFLAQALPPMRCSSMWF